MTGAAQLIEGLVKPQPAALMRAHPRNRLESAADPTYEPDPPTHVKGFHHARGHICARRDDPPAAINGLHRGPVSARMAVEVNARATGSGDNTGTTGEGWGGRGDNHLGPCCGRTVEGVGGVVDTRYPSGDPA